MITQHLGRAVAAAIILILLGTSRIAGAAIYVVTANPDMTFTPESITIHQGDAIRFENAGGVHNVHADDDSFICALNCNTNTAPSDLPWSVVVRFNHLGTIGYYCDQHGNTTSGMRGSITVIDRIFVDGFDDGSPPSS
ncbi:MAG TPA: plastocyanin/azurin family copper-binding protein [Rhodanobacteraceae bacterium]|nr:plastocyanin/azurin family copper-binding protein [Rhodanobacteraceae bacterium]